MKFYLTTAIDYVNDRPHLGHVLEKVQADAIARYRRLQGDRVYFLTGTDEHGLKNYRAAKKLGLSPQAFVNRQAKTFLALKNDLNLSTNDFIRTSDRKRHYPAVEKLWGKLLQAGALKKKAYRGLYCVGCEAFLTAKELVAGLCPIHRIRLDRIEETNWFFTIKPKLRRRVEQALKKGEIKLYPSHRTKEVLNALAGMPDVSFSRPREKLPWGIPVPHDPTQVIYVWADALTNYLSAIGYAQGTHRKLWPVDLHIVGKDILRFHAALWPLMLLEIGEKLPRAILVHGFIKLEGRKMGKSSGHFVEPRKILKKYSVDPLRYYLLKEVPTQEDGDFSWERLEILYKKELADLLGNSLSRTLAMVDRYGEGRVPQRPGHSVNLIRENLQTYRQRMDSYDLNEALAAALGALGRISREIDYHKPWELIKKDPERVGGLLYQWLEILRLSSVLLYPFMPDTAQEIRKQLGLKPLQEKAQKTEYQWGLLRPGTKLGRSKILFPKS